MSEKLPRQVGMVLNVAGLKSAQLGEIVLEGLGLLHVVGEDVIQPILIRLGVLALVHRFGSFGLLSLRDKSRLQQSGLQENARQFVLARPFPRRRPTTVYRRRWCRRKEKPAFTGETATGPRWTAVLTIFSLLVRTRVAGFFGGNQAQGFLVNPTVSPLPFHFHFPWSVILRVTSWPIEDIYQ